MFLVALCLSIFLEAIQRLVEPQEVSHPKLVLIVGCFGLASNIVGLFLFHDHGHGHGGHSHSHGDNISDAEEGHAHSAEADLADERGNIVDVLPENRVKALASTYAKGPEGKTKARPAEISWQTSSPSRERLPRKTASGKRVINRHHRSRSRRYSQLEEISVHPASFRNDIIAASRLESDSDSDESARDDELTENSPLLQKSSNATIVPTGASSEPAKKTASHADHKHNHAKDEGKKGGHSHGDLNMRGVFLHVMGDALGNIGVIGSALIIWLTDYTWRFYADPVISLIITVIILCSAIPLCKAASRILLQAVPAGLSIDDIKDDISELDGIISCHHLHVWQLSDTKLIASLHVQVGFDFKGEGSARYMALAREIRKCLHEYGIHSSTIQPEFCLDANHDHSGGNSAAEDAGSQDMHSHSSSGSTPRPSNRGSKTNSEQGDEACLLACGDDCGNGKQCCTTEVQGCVGGK